MNKYVYLDHAATTCLKREVLDQMHPYLTESFGNASSNYQLGMKSKEAIENARDKVATALACKAGEVFFTSGGTESDNWAIKGVALANKLRGNHIITSSIEHPAVGKTCEYLHKLGFEITYLSVDEYGVVSLDELKSSIRNDTILISIMFANNEVGTLQPIKEIGQIAKEKNIYFHTDAVQAIGSVEIDVNEYNIDLLSVSAHKLYGPKGIGALYVRDGVKIDSLFHGGSQEQRKRAGTENVANCVGLGKAMEIATQDIFSKNQKIMRMRNNFVQTVLREIPNALLNGHPINRLPGNANITFKSVNSRYLTSILDSRGICASNGSACGCRSDNASQVLLAMKKSEDIAFSAMRFTFGEENTEEEVNYVVEVLSEEINRLINHA